MELLATLGLVKEIREAQLETFGTVAGCSPAFVALSLYGSISWRCEKAVLERSCTKGTYLVKLSAQMIKGTATLEHEKKAPRSIESDEVTSPGGSTIRGVVKL